MKKEIDSIIKEALEKVQKGDDASIQEAANMILGGNGVTAGSTVAIIDDPTFSSAGLKGKVKGPSAKGSGFMDVEMPDGSVLQLQTSLLLPL
jgi:hypothetical protein